MIKTVNHQSHWTKHLIAAGIITAFTLLVFGRSLSIGYLADDYQEFAVIEGTNYSPFSASGQGIYFRPLKMLSLQVGQIFGPENATFYQHVINIILHIFNDILIFSILHILTGQWLFALGVSLFFLVHPANVTDVYWIAARVDSILALFYLAGLLGFIMFLRSGAKGWIGVSILGMAGNLLTKEAGVTLVAVLLITFFFIREWGIPKFRVFGLKMKWAIATLGFQVLLTLSYLVYILVRFYVPTGWKPGTDITHVLTALLAYPLLLILPNNQNSLIRIYKIYPFLFWVMLGLFAFIAVVVMIFMIRKLSRKSILQIIALIALVCIPVLPMAIMIGGMNSRRLYLPIAMLCVGIGFWVLVKPRIGRYLVLPIYSLTVVAAIISYSQGSLWVQNWQATQTACQDFREIAAGEPVDTQIIVLTFPRGAKEIPIYGGNLNYALYFCLNQRFGRSDNIVSVTGLLTDDGTFLPGTVALTQPQPEVFEITIQQGNAFLYPYPSDACAGDIYSNSIASETVLAIRDDARVTSVRLDFYDPGILSKNILIYFDGSTFKRIKPPD